MISAWDGATVIAMRLVLMWILWELSRAIKSGGETKVTGDMQPVVDSLAKIRKLFHGIESHIEKNRNGKVFQEPAEEKSENNSQEMH